MSDLPIFKFAVREDLKDTGDLFIPTKGEPLATGWDVKAAMPDRKPLILVPFQHVKIPLGFRTFAPEGWWYELKPRSSTFAKKNLHALYGTIDETYSNELIFACQYIPNWNEISPMHPELTINFGDAVGQIIPVKRQEMTTKSISNDDFDKLCKDRNAVRNGGFGSTDPSKVK
ncbi:Dut dUTPase [uncultured Caudovirales phage]|uniref:Dut dUTPase n=1 Tax=uncultured Caudovirales phage TaxID=2100421 RepID=A0A6J5RKJ5_9CAUD|nr:Dut dUTPase [uncultured Caudovirales phage]